MPPEFHSRVPFQSSIKPPHSCYFSFFFFITHNSNSIQHIGTVCIPSDCTTIRDLPFLGQSYVRATCVRSTSYGPKNTRHSGFPIHHFMHNYMHKSKSKGRIRTFYLSNDCSTVRNIYFLGQSGMRDTIGKLWIQTCIITTFQYDIWCILILITLKLKVVCRRSTCRTTVLLSEMSIFSVRTGCEILMAAYASKHKVQSFSGKPVCHIKRYGSTS